MGGGARQAIVHGLKELDTIEQIQYLHFSRVQSQVFQIGTKTTLIVSIDFLVSVFLNMEILSPSLNIYSLMHNLFILDVFSLKYVSTMFYFICVVCVSDLLLYSYTMYTNLMYLFYLSL